MSLLSALLWGKAGRRSETFPKTSYPPYPSYPSAGGGPASSPSPSAKPPGLDPRTLVDVLGPKPDPHLVACIRFDVWAAVIALEAEMRTGTIAPGIRLVHGRPLADWLDLDTLARLLRSASGDGVPRP